MRFRCVVRSRNWIVYINEKFILQKYLTNKAVVLGIVADGLQQKYVRKSTNRCILEQDVFQTNMSGLVVSFPFVGPGEQAGSRYQNLIQSSQPINFMVYETNFKPWNSGLVLVPSLLRPIWLPTSHRGQRFGKPPRCTGVKLEISSLQTPWWFGYSRTAKQLQPLEALIQSRENGNLCLSKVWLICGENRWNN